MREIKKKLSDIFTWISLEAGRLLLHLLTTNAVEIARWIVIVNNFPFPNEKNIL